MDDNYAPANLGQVKLVFSFDLTGFDTDLDGMPNAWEQVNFGDPTAANPNDDAEGDGVSNLQEFQNGTDPHNADSDYDGRSDEEEARDGTNGTDAASAKPMRLAQLRFSDSALAAESGASPKSIVNPTNPTLLTTSGWRGSALNMTGRGTDAGGTATSRLVYRDVESDGRPNINLRQGTIRMWVRPNWSTGTGPGSWARLLEMGWYTSPPSYGFWGIHFTPAGDQLAFTSEDAPRPHRHPLVEHDQLDRGHVARGGRDLRTGCDGVLHRWRAARHGRPR